MGSGTGCKFSVCWRKLFRIKSQRLNAQSLEGAGEGRLRRIFDLTNVGVASTLSISIYIVSCQTFKDVAGPSAILSCLIAALAAACSFVCYAELRSRWATFDGVAYDYTYFSAGELAAFTVGWFTLLQYVACVSTLGRAVSVNIDVLTGFQMFNLTLDNVGEIEALHSVPVFLAGFVILVMATVASLGTTLPKHTHLVTSICIIFLTLFVMTVGLFHLDFNNWHDFFPFRIGGVVEGAATMFYAFTFFDIITNKSDLVGRGGKATIVSSALSATVILLMTVGVVAILSLLSPRHVVRTDATYAEMFENAGVTWVKYIIAIGAICALIITLWDKLLEGSVVLQRIATDGLVFEFIQWTKNKGELSTIPAFVIGILSVIFSIIFPMTNLVELTSFSALVVYTVSCLSVTSLRYNTPKSFAMANLKNRRKRRRRKKQGPIYRHDGSVSYGATFGHSNPSTTSSPHDDSLLDLSNGAGNGHISNGIRREGEDSSDTDIDDIVEEYREKVRVKALTSCGIPGDRMDIPSEATHKRASWALTLFTFCMLCFSAILCHGTGLIREGSVICILLVAVFVLLSLLAAWILMRQPLDIEDMSDVSITIPVLPWIPLIAIVLNTHLMMRFGSLIWLQVFLWSIGGVVMYFGYGIRHSTAGHTYSILPNENHGLLPGASDDNSAQSRGLAPDGDAALLE